MWCSVSRLRYKVGKQCDQSIIITDVNYDIAVLIWTPSLQVGYGSGTRTQNLTDGMTVSIAGFSPGSAISLTVTITNSMGSTSYSPPSYTLCESTPGVVQGLKASQIESTSIELQWDAPVVQNGFVFGYSVSQGGTKVRMWIGHMP